MNRVNSPTDEPLPPGRRDAIGWILTVTAALGLTGLALQSLIGHGPWLELLWQERWMSPVVRGLTGMSWSEYVGDPDRATKLAWVGVGVGVIYGIAALLCVLGRPQWLAGSFLGLAAALVGLEAWLSYADHGYRIFQLIEHALQVIAPLAVVGWVFLHRRGRVLQWPLRLAVAMTFTGHGVWALGLSLELGPVSLHYPTPGRWVDMVLSILPMLDEQTARHLLKVAGALDLVVAVAVLFPPRWARPALVWATAWGGATAAARIAAHVGGVEWMDSISYWIGAALRRAPHAGLPLALLLLLNARTPGHSVRGTRDRGEADRADQESQGSTIISETAAAATGPSRR